MEQLDGNDDEDERSDHSSDFQGTPVGSDDDIEGDDELRAPYETDNRMVGKIKKVLIANFCLILAFFFLIFPFLDS